MTSKVSTTGNTNIGVCGGEKEELRNISVQTPKKRVGEVIDNEEDFSPRSDVSFTDSPPDISSSERERRGKSIGIFRRRRCRKLQKQAYNSGRSIGQKHHGEPAFSAGAWGQGSRVSTAMARFLVVEELYGVAPAEGQEVKRAVLVQRVVRHKRILRQGVPGYVDWKTTK